jgi:hypothetical protein
MLTKNSANLYRFYKEESSMIHIDSNESFAETCSGLDRIKARIAELSLPDGVTVDLKEGTVDAQRSENDAVFLLVTGRFIHPGQSPRPFVQSFVLALQANPAAVPGSAASYYVRNSVFRILSSAVTTVVLERVVEVPVPEVATAPAPHQLEPVRAHEEDEQHSHWDQPPAALEHHHHPEVEEQETVEMQDSSAADEVSQALSGTRSFADMVRGWGQPAAPPVNNDHVRYTKTAATPKAPAVPAEEKKDGGGRPNCAIYVNHVEAGIKQPDIVEFFSPFGTVSSVDLPIGRGFAFVEFLESEAVQAVLAKHNKEPLALSGKELHIEERQAKGRGGGSKFRGDKPEGKEKKAGEKKPAAGGGDKKVGGVGDKDSSRRGGGGDKKAGGGGQHVGQKKGPTTVTEESKPKSS